MGQFSLTVCVATGDFGKPATVGVATNERVMSDGTALDVTAPAIGVGVGVVIQDIEDDMGGVIAFAICVVVDIGGAATKEETIAVGLL